MKASGRAEEMDSSSIKAAAYDRRETKAVRALQKGKFASAVRLASGLTGIDDGRSSGHFLVGICYQLSGMKHLVHEPAMANAYLEGSLEHFAAAVARETRRRSLASFQYQMGVSYDLLGEQHNRDKCWSRAEELDHDHVANRKAGDIREFRSFDETVARFRREFLEK